MLCFGKTNPFDLSKVMLEVLECTIVDRSTEMIETET